MDGVQHSKSCPPGSFCVTIYPFYGTMEYPIGCICDVIDIFEEVSVALLKTYYAVPATQGLCKLFLVKVLKRLHILEH